MFSTLKKIYRFITPRRIQCKIRLFRGYSYYSEYNNKTETIFIHIPKTAGSSVSSMIFDDMKASHEHLPIQYYYDESHSKFNKFFKFAFVREPISRFISAYNYFSNLPDWVQKPTTAYANKHILPYKNINDFIDHFKTNEEVKKWPHFKLQSYYTNVKGKMVLDFVGHFENLNSDMEVLCGHIGVKYKETPHVNKSKKNKNLDVISEENKRYLRDFYKEDYETFSYD